MKSNKQLDEMQESKLLKIQEKGFWLVFWILFAAIFVQALIGMTLKEIAGEHCCFGGCKYLYCCGIP